METKEFTELIRRLIAASAEDWRKSLLEGLAASNCQAARDQDMQRVVVEDLCLSVRANLVLLHDVMLGWRVPRYGDHGKVDYVMPAGEAIPVMQAAPPEDTPIETLGFHKTSRKHLEAMGITTLKQLLGKSGIDLTSRSGFGEGSLLLLRRRLAVFGLRLADGIVAE